jgi:hypothetical protein
MGIDRILIHTCTIKKEPKALVAKQPVNTAPTTVAILVKCRIEPLRTQDRETILGRWPKAKYTATFDNVTLEEGYIITAIAGYSGIAAAEAFNVRELIEDTGRATLRYKTCILEERR